nr:gag pol polyprotein [Hymenolepis microstoma]
MPFGPRNAIQSFQRFMDQVFQIDFLGHHINGREITPLPEKTQSILSYPDPQSVKGLRRFLGIVNYYGRFTPNCAHILQPPIDLLKGNPKHFKMTSEVESAFSVVKQELSKKLTTTETRYSTFSRELLAIYLAVEHFRYILEGRQFTIFTDNKPLISAFRATADHHSARGTRHLNFIAQLTSDVRHIDGAINVVADAMFRMELNQTVVPSLDLQALASEQRPDLDFTEISSNSSVSPEELRPFPWFVAPKHSGYNEVGHRSFHLEEHPAGLSSVGQKSAILLSQSAVKEDMGCCPAELVPGTTLRLPRELICDAQNRAPVDPSSYSARLKEHFGSALPTPTRLIYIPSIFVRVDAVKKPLRPPYDRPYKVLQRKSKYFILDRNGTEDSVSIDRLKPALAVRTHRPNLTTQTAEFTVPPPSSPPHHHNPFPVILRTL